MHHGTVTVRSRSIARLSCTSSVHHRTVTTNSRSTVRLSCTFPVHHCTMTASSRHTARLSCTFSVHPCTMTASSRRTARLSCTFSVHHRTKTARSCSPLVFHAHFLCTIAPRPHTAAPRSPFMHIFCAPLPIGSLQTVCGLRILFTPKPAINKAARRDNGTVVRKLSLFAFFGKNSGSPVQKLASSTGRSGAHSPSV